MCFMQTTYVLWRYMRIEYLSQSWAPAGGAIGGTCPPPWKFKNMGAPKDDLTRKKYKKSRGPDIVSEETDLGGPL